MNSDDVGIDKIADDAVVCMLCVCVCVCICVFLRVCVAIKPTSISFGLSCPLVFTPTLV